MCCNIIYSIEKKDYSPFPNPDVGYVTDIAGVLSDTQKKALNNRLYTTEENTGVEIAVVTINSIKDYPGSPNGSIEDFAHGLFDAYGIGNLPNNNGILLLVAIRDRRARIELGNGYGLLKDVLANRIMQNVIIPEFKNNRYDLGIIEGITSIIRTFPRVSIVWFWIRLVFLILILLMPLVAISLFLNGKRGWGQWNNK